MQHNIVEVYDFLFMMFSYLLLQYTFDLVVVVVVATGLKGLSQFQVGGLR